MQMMVGGKKKSGDGGSVKNVGMSSLYRQSVDHSQLRGRTVQLAQVPPLQNNSIPQLTTGLLAGDQVKTVAFLATTTLPLPP